ncbi:MAG: hypothetical protein ACYDC3_05740 [Candidatus Binataceae bacterium]
MAFASPLDGDVGVCESIAFEEQRLTGGFRQSVSKLGFDSVDDFFSFIMHPPNERASSLLGVPGSTFSPMVSPTFSMMFCWPRIRLILVADVRRGTAIGSGGWRRIILRKCGRGHRDRKQRRAHR